jgi:hypothetical protein
LSRTWALKQMVGSYTSTFAVTLLTLRITKDLFPAPGVRGVIDRQKLNGLALGSCMGVGVNHCQ